MNNGILTKENECKFIRVDEGECRLMTMNEGR